MSSAPADQESPRVSKSPDAADFSTSYWKELRLHHSRPEIYLAVLAAYLLLLLPAGADRMESKVVTGWLWGLAAACAVVLSVATAARVAGRLSRREFLDALRAETAGSAPDKRNAHVGAACRRELLRASVEPALAAALLAPLYIVIGYGLFLFEPNLAAGEGFGLWLWLNTVGLVVASAMVAGWGTHALASRWSPLLAVTAALGAPLALVTAIWLVANVSDLSVILVELPYATVILCVVGAGLAFSRGTKSLLLRLAETGSRNPERDSEADRQRALGLDISFWAIFRWKLFRDPLFRAERRSFWNGRRLAVMWILMVIYAALWPVALLLVCRLGYYAVFSWPYYIILDVLRNLPFWLTPALVAASLATDRQTGTLDDITITPTAPLRLAAAKLFGRCSHILLAWLVVQAPQYLFHWWLVERYGQGGIDLWFGTIWGSIVEGMLTALFAALGLVAFSAIGLYFAARVRSLAGALVLTYLTMLAIWQGLPLAGHQVQNLFSIDSSNAGMAVLACLAALYLLVFLAVLRFFLMGAAKHLALRRGE